MMRPQGRWRSLLSLSAVRAASRLFTRRQRATEPGAGHPADRAGFERVLRRDEDQRRRAVLVHGRHWRDADGDRSSDGAAGRPRDTSGGPPARWRHGRRDRDGDDNGRTLDVAGLAPFAPGGPVRRSGARERRVARPSDRRCARHGFSEPLRRRVRLCGRPGDGQAAGSTAASPGRRAIECP